MIDIMESIIEAIAMASNPSICDKYIHCRATCGKFYNDKQHLCC